MERNSIGYFNQNLFLLVVLFCWKRITFKISMKFHFKRGNMIFKHNFWLHLMCYVPHKWFLWTTHNLSFRIYFYIAPRRSQKTTIIFFHFRLGCETHFLVLAQTLIYCFAFQANAMVKIYWVALLIAYPPAANFTTMHIRVVWQDRNLGF